MGNNTSTNWIPPMGPMLYSHLQENRDKIEDPADIRTLDLLTPPWTDGKVKWMRALKVRDYKAFKL